MKTLEDIKAYTDKQPRIEDLKTAQEIKKRLQTGKITKVLYQFKKKNIYLVLLNNNLLAIFKERNKSARENEILAFEMASVLFKLPHTIPPTVAREYKGISGVLQYYAVATVDFKAGNSYEFHNRDNMALVLRTISRDSYADFQVFKYIAALGDVNLEGLVVWKNSLDQYCLTYVDNEFLLGNIHEKFGKTSFGKLDITNSNFYDAVINSKYTSIFHSSTLDNIAVINRDDLMALLILHYSTSEEFQAMVEIFFKNRDSLLDAAQLIQIKKNLNTYLPSGFPNTAVDFIAEQAVESVREYCSSRRLICLRIN